MVKMFKYTVLFWTVFFVLQGIKGQEQIDIVLEQSISRVNELLDSSNVFLLKNAYIKQEGEIPGFLFLSNGLLPENKTELTDAYYELKKKFLSSDLGIRFTGNYNNNINGGFAEDEDIYYNQRTYLGLEWNVMQTGSIGNRKKINAIENEKQIELIEIQEESIKRDYYFNQQYITASFIHAQTPYLEQRLEVLWGLFNIYQELFYLKRIKWERLLKVKGEIKKVELMIRRNKQILKYAGFEDNELLDVDRLPVYGINTRHLLKGIPLAKFDSLKYALKIDNLGLSYDDYIDKVSVRPYVRYNLYDFLSYKARSYPSAGITLNLPVQKRTGKKKLMKVEKQLLEDEYLQEKDDLFSDALQLSRTYEEKIQDFVYLVYQRDLLKERINRELKKREINLLGFNGIEALSYFDEFLSCEADILDKKKAIYLSLLNVSYVAKGEDPAMYLEKLGYDLSYKNYPGNRSVYLWSELFNVMNNDHLFSFMHDREIDNVLLSLSRNSDSLKLKTFIDKAEKYGINILGLVGNNMLVKHDKERVLTYLNSYAHYNLSAIHLDVEPHALDDFKENKAAYLDKLMALYKLTKSWCDSRGMELSVSLPFHYPHEFIDKAFEVCDHVYIMNYNAKNEKQLIDRLNGYTESKYLDKLVVSLRLSDFNTLKALDFSLLVVSKNTGVQNYCFNDLRGLNRMTSDLSALNDDSPEYQPYRVEMGSLKSDEEARALSEKIKKLKYNGQVTWKRNGSYCVVLGYFNNFDAAQRTLKRIAERHPDLPKPWIYMVY